LERENIPFQSSHYQTKENPEAEKMSSNEINRRDFLKSTLLLLPLLKPSLFYKFKASRLDLQTGKSDSHFPNILILVFDALSAKHMSLYGYRRQTTPNIDKFAERATVFHKHYSAGNFTLPGTASLLTGTYPWKHRGFHLYGTTDKGFAGKNIFSIFEPNFQTFTATHNPVAMGLLEQFRGYIDHFTPARDLDLISYPISDRIFRKDYTVANWSEMTFRGLDRYPSGSLNLPLFDKLWQAMRIREIGSKYKDLFPAGLPGTQTGFFILEAAMDWIVNQLSKEEQPFLGYYHLFPPHGPYKPRREFLDVFNDGWQPPAKPTHFFSENVSEDSLKEERQRYDEYIAYADSEFGRLISRLEQNGILKNTLLIITSDHGEMFERGILAHITPTMYEPLIHIPLVVAQPGQQEAFHVKTNTSSIDVLPTLAKISGEPVPDWCEGQILPLSGESKEENVRSIYSVEAKENPKHGPLKKATVVLLKGNYKLIHYFGYDNFQDEYELYDLENDPEELDNLYSSNRIMAEELSDEMAEKIKKINSQ